jgi:FkbM family methyltransferase
VSAGDETVSRAVPEHIVFGHHAHNDRWAIEAIFGGLHAGFFVEAGACGGGTGSASLVLERDFGWNGICVEPGDTYFETLSRNRRCAKDHRCLSDRTGEFVEFLSYPDDLARSGIRSLNKNDGWAHQHDAAGVTTTKETVTLADLLEQHGAPPTIHYLCLDVEGAERTILEPFDFEGPRRILAISVEGPKCDDLLAGRGYLRARNPFASRQFDHYFVSPKLRERCRELLLADPQSH